MKRLVWWSLLGLFVVGGCQKSEPEAPAAEPKTATKEPAGGITPMAPGSGVPNAPVNNAQSVEGAGMGGAGQSAKDRARAAAASAGSPAGMNGGDSEPSGQ